MRNGLALGLALGYPLLVVGAGEWIEPRYLALGLLPVLLLRWRRGTPAGGAIPAAVLAFFLLTAVLVNQGSWLLVYPVVVSGIFFTVFVHSLLNPPTVVERLARLTDPDLPPRGVEYTRKVTRAWCGFFLGNGLIAAATVWHGDKTLWGIYNGLVSYLLMGILMGGEWLIRQRIRKGFSDAG